MSYVQGSSAAAQVGADVHIYGHTHIATLGQVCTIAGGGGQHQQQGQQQVAPTAGAAAGGQAGSASGSSSGAAAEQREVLFVHNPLEGSAAPALCCVWDGDQVCCQLVAADGSGASAGG
jgi:hypothetical protein